MDATLKKILDAYGEVTAHVGTPSQWDKINRLEALLAQAYTEYVNNLMANVGCAQFSRYHKGNHHLAPKWNMLYAGKYTLTE